MQSPTDPAGKQAPSPVETLPHSTMAQQSRPFNVPTSGSDVQVQEQVLSPSHEEAGGPWYHVDDGDAADVVDLRDAAPRSMAPLNPEFVRHMKELNKDTQQRQPRSPQKPKRFIDRQHNAQRVDFTVDSQDTQLASTTHPSKRQGPVSDDEDDDRTSEDEGFQHDNRPANRATSRRVEAPLARRRSPVPVHDSSPIKRARTGVVSQERPTARPSEETEASRIGTPTSSRHRQTNEDAKSFIAMRAMRAPKVQHRKPWTAAEEDALIKYVEDIGWSCARIKKEDQGEYGEGFNILRQRDQIALKDKAVNIKMDCLK